jgi:hypothetical protein
VSPVRYELGFYIPEYDIIHSHRRENLKSYRDYLSFQFTSLAGRLSSGYVFELCFWKYLYVIFVMFTVEQFTSWILKACIPSRIARFLDFLKQEINIVRQVRPWF